ncbi:hypothetical protein ACWDBD_32055 [Streptomyces sp. NPDC001118]
MGDWLAWEEARLSWDEADENFLEDEGDAHSEIALAARALYAAKRRLRG